MDNVPATAISSGPSLVRHAVIADKSLPGLVVQRPTAEPRIGQIGYGEKLSHGLCRRPGRLHIGVWFVPSEEPRRDG